MTSYDDDDEIKDWAGRGARLAEHVGAYRRKGDFRPLHNVTRDDLWHGIELAVRKALGFDVDAVEEPERLLGAWEVDAEEHRLLEVVRPASSRPRRVASKG